MTTTDPLLGMVADALDPQADLFAADPQGWVEQRLNEVVWSKQLEVMESVRDNRFTNVRSAHSTGKSHIAARIAGWWEDVHPPEETFIVSTAPSTNQVRGILWRYLKAVHRKAGLDGYITGGDVPEWKLPGDVLVGWGRKPQDLSNAEQAATVFQGIHAKYLLVILDEAGGVPEWLWNAILTLVSDEAGYGRVLAIGNPDDPTSHFSRIASPGSTWTNLQIKAFDSPNFIGDPRYTGTPEMEAFDRDLPEDVVAMLVGPTFVKTAEDEWGDDSPLYVSKVLAEFPEESDDALIPIALVRAAVERDMSGEAITDLGKAAMDVARTGTDETTLGWNRGGMFRIIRHKRGLGDTMKAAGWLSVFQREHPAVPIIVDADGLGAGVYDRALELGLQVSAFYAGRRAYKPKRFVNRRAEQWWALRKLFEDGLLDIDRDDLTLQAQLTGMKFDEDSAGRVKVESKDDMKRRGLPSPDRADTLMMVYAPATNLAAPSPTQPKPRSKGEGSLTNDLLDKEW